MILATPNFRAGARVFLVGQQQPFEIIERRGDWVEMKRPNESSLAPTYKVHVNALESH